jgi:hypothetical protein
MTKMPNFSTALQSIKTWITERGTAPIRNKALVFILLLGLMQSILFALVIPPWWHYDEPGHFEYAWLVANLPAWPEIGQFNQTMRVEMAKSLEQYGWYKARLENPDLSGTQPIPIGVLQVGGEPAYYFLASLPLRLMHQANILIQYFAARAVSIILYLLTLLAAWYALGEIVTEDHPLRWMAPAFLALLPAFVDVMTAVNNDVAAVLAATLFMWASFKLIKKGFSIGRLIFLAAALGFCYLSKNTAWFAFALAPFVLIFSLLRGRFTWLVIGISVLGMIIAPFALLEGGTATGWYQSPAQAARLRIASTNAPLGNYVFQIDPSKVNASGQVLQNLTPDVVKSIRGRYITVGAWLWANQTIQIHSPHILFASNNNGTEKGRVTNSAQTPLVLGTTPTFYRFIMRVPNNASYANIIITYLVPSADSKIFVDGLVAAVGQHGTTPPHFNEAGGTTGTWDSREFQNLIRNGSAEQNSLRFRPWIGEKLNTNSSSLFNLPFILESFLDWQGSNWYYTGTVGNLFRTFWASLAANKVLVPSASFYFLVLLTLLGMAGTGRILWLNRKSIRWDMVFLLGLSMLLPWGLALVRGVSGVLIGSPIISWARYADTAILPTALMLCAGWWSWLELMKDRWKLSDVTLSAVFWGGMSGISILALVDAIQVFHTDWWGSWASLAFLLIVQAAIMQFIIHGKTRVMPDPSN